MTREGKGMQVLCTLHFKGHKKFIGILKKFNWTDTFSVMQGRLPQNVLDLSTT